MSGSGYAPNVTIAIDGETVEPAPDLLAEVAEEARRKVYCHAKIGQNEPCGERATHIFFWPGRGESRQCEAHTRRAVHIADVMGFTLPVFAIDPAGMERYENLIETLMTRDAPAASSPNAQRFSLLDETKARHVCAVVTLKPA